MNPMDASPARLCRHAAVRFAGALVVSAFLSGACVPSQNASTTPSDPTEGTRIYAQRCAGCHGADARGTDKAPALAENGSLRDRSVRELRDLILKGIPASGMPAFDLPADELNALAALVRSLNLPPAKETVRGNPLAGESFFFGKGQCASCHMIFGIGTAVGPDLSTVGQEMTADEIAAKLASPNSHITPGYELATVQLRDGNTIHGFVRSRSNFDIQLQDLTGKFHLLQQGEISALTEEKQSIMPPLNASPKELGDLIAYLGRRTGLSAPALKSSASQAPGLDFASILNPTPGEWLTYNGMVTGNRYSELT